VAIITVLPKLSTVFPSAFNARALLSLQISSEVDGRRKCQEMCGSFNLVLGRIACIDGASGDLYWEGIGASRIDSN
jgi:hypothetical protein